MTFIIFPPAEFYKAAKLGANGDVKNKGKSAAVEDEDEEDEGEAGPELPPDFEEDLPDDEEGRFFGGGMTKETSQAMEYLDQQDKDEVAAVSGKERASRLHGSDLDNLLYSPRKLMSLGFVA